jgi:nucleoside-diphosphate-sugar epimerase
VGQPIAKQRFFIVGGAGFIGSHFCDHLLGPGGAAGVTLYDNFSSGRPWHYAQHASDPRLRVVRGEVEDASALAAAMDGHDVVIHLASNPDSTRAHHRLHAGDRAHQRGGRGDADHQRQADPVRLGQRRLR